MTDSPYVVIVNDPDKWGGQYAVGLFSKLIDAAEYASGTEIVTGKGTTDIVEFEPLGELPIPKCDGGYTP